VFLDNVGKCRKGLLQIKVKRDEIGYFTDETLNLTIETKKMGFAFNTKPIIIRYFSMEVKKYFYFLMSF